MMSCGDYAHWSVYGFYFVRPSAFDLIILDILLSHLQACVGLGAHY